MALKIICDSCGENVVPGEALRRTITYNRLENNVPFLTYINATEDFCMDCVEKEAAPFEKVRAKAPRKPREAPVVLEAALAEK
ncbi:MAG TPA: hypothetical protein VK638_40685 [Edaphobacter sp.]|nr:hypothetical protein [Edaphobacter sp.]